VTFALSNTTSGRTYWLYKGAEHVNTLTSIGGAATFTGNFAGACVYTAQVIAESGNCAAVMNGTHNVSENTLPDTPTLTASASTVCQGTNVVFRASGTAGSTFTWLGTAGTASGTDNGTLTVSGTATGSKSVSAYARLTSSGTICQSVSAATVTAVVNPKPTITHNTSGGAASQSVYLGSAISAISYTAPASATFTKTGSTFPSGLNVSNSGSSYTIYGQPNTAGTYGYSLTASVNGCTSAASVGTITVSDVAPPTNAASTQTWTYGTQTWSDFINIPACKDSVFASSLDKPHCRAYNAIGPYYYNWTYVSINTESFCVAPWHLASQAEVEYLHSLPNIAAKLTVSWGYTGYANGSSILYETRQGHVWSGAAVGNGGFQLYYTSTATNTNGYAGMYGMPVRCVK
jgi:hypothetical protein